MGSWVHTEDQFRVRDLFATRRRLGRFFSANIQKPMDPGWVISISKWNLAKNVACLYLWYSFYLLIFHFLCFTQVMSLMDGARERWEVLILYHRLKTCYISYYKMNAIGKERKRSLTISVLSHSVVSHFLLWPHGL